MKQLPTGGILGKAQKAWQFIRKQQIPLYAANASYFIILAVFPSLVLLLSLLRYTPWDVHTLLDLLSGIFPTSLVPMVEKLVLSVYQSSSTALISVSAIVALWSASRGVYGLLTGLNAVYDVPESRGYLYTRAISVVYTFLFLIVLLLTLLLHVFGTALLGFLQKSDHPLLRFLTDVVDLRFFLLLALQTALFAAMFLALPNRRSRLGDALPGAFLASIGWQVFSFGFSIYMDHDSGLSSVYGSVYALALSMLWLYFCISILFYGGALNALLMENEKK